jgi:hypothetical protein
MFCFVTAVILCAFYDLDMNVALFMSVFVIIVYFIIFKDKVNRLRAFASSFFMGILKFKTVGEDAKNKKKNKNTDSPAPPQAVSAPPPPQAVSAPPPQAVSAPPPPPQAVSAPPLQAVSAPPPPQGK